MFKKLLLHTSIIIAVVMMSCDANSQRPHKNTEQIAEKFRLFFQKFEANPDFQVSRINFPLTLITSNEDGVKEKKLIKKNQWKYTNMLKLHDAIITYKKITIDSINVQYSIKDTGVSVDHIFCEKQGQWKLCLIINNSD